LLKSEVAVFDEMRKGLQQIEFIKEPDTGELRIGSSIVTDAGLLPAIMERFSQYSRARSFTFCLKTSRFSNMTICVIEELNWYSAGFQRR